MNKNVKSKICISSESTIDCPKELLDKYDIHTVPFTVQFGNQVKYDGNINPKEIFEYCDETGDLPKTSAVNLGQFEDYFKGLLQDYETVIHISFSSGMSSVYNNACIVRDELEEMDEYKNRIYIIDSKNLSSAVALLAIYAAKLKKKLDDPLEIVKLVEKRVPDVSGSFLVTKLNYLCKGGRCSSAQAFLSSVLSIRLEIIIEKGKMLLKKKVVGTIKQSIEKYINNILEEYNHPDLDTVFVSYTTASQGILDKVKEILKQKGFKHIYFNVAGATCSCHCGEHCLGILFFNDGNKPQLV